MRIVVDTNSLVSFLTDRSPQQQALVAELISAASEGEHRLLLPQIVLSELVYVLQNLYAVSAGEAAAILTDLLALSGAEPIHDVSWSEVLALWPTAVPTFADAVVVATSRRARADAIATFDGKLRRRMKVLEVKSYW
ncbi:MAG TPA: PIN domain-containing protein [Thermoanaerobaculia bacterium]|nr:PIN domain-containing protein [Thermoanaerobaculia bacterium]